MALDTRARAIRAFLAGLLVMPGGVTVAHTTVLEFGFEAREIATSRPDIIVVGTVDDEGNCSMIELTDSERRKFALYCKHMTRAESDALVMKEKILKQQSLPEQLILEMTKKDKQAIFAWHVVAEELGKWDDAETITAKDAGTL